MVCVIVCQTPLHFFLSMLMLEKNEQKKVFVFVEESAIDEQLVAGVLEQHSARIIRLPGAAKNSTKVGRFWRKYLNVRALKADKDISSANELLLFNDTTPETQYLMDTVFRRGGVITLGEDGVAIYELGGVIPCGRMNRVLGKVFFGGWWSPADRIGTSEKISNVFASYPKALREEVLLNRVVDRVPVLSVERAAKQFASSAVELPVNASLCIVPLIASVGDKAVRDFISMMLESGQSLIVKFHPRESEEQVENVLAGLAGIVSVAPQSLPAEMLYGMAKGCGLIVGFRSSALHILSALFPCAKVEYYEPFEDLDGVKWRHFYEQLEFVRYSLG